VETWDVDITTNLIEGFDSSPKRRKLPSGEIDRPAGPENLVEVPIPSTFPDVDPARVETVAVERIIIRTRLPPSSVTNAESPFGEMTIPRGSVNWAFVPKPLALPSTVLPARVVTEEVKWMSFRIILLRESTIKEKVPSGEIEIPLGPLNVADVPMPFELPEVVLPAKVLTKADSVLIILT
jgi:hypothetical protein